MYTYECLCPNCEGRFQLGSDLSNITTLLCPRCGQKVTAELVQENAPVPDQSRASAGHTIFRCECGGTKFEIFTDTQKFGCCSCPRRYSLKAQIAVETKARITQMSLGLDES